MPTTPTTDKPSSRPPDRRFRFTKSRIDRAAHDPARAGRYTVYRDTDLRGFCLRVMATGEKSFFIEFRDRGGRKRQLHIEKWGGPLSVDEARDKAREELAANARGDDPVEQRRRQRHGDTMAAAATRYLANLKSRAEAGGEQRLAGWDSARQLWERHVPDALKGRRVADVTVEDIRRPLQAIAKAGHPATSDKTRTVLHAVMETARAESLRPDNPVAAVKPYNKPGEQRRALTLDELGKLGEALRTVEATGKLTVRETVKRKGREVEADVTHAVAREAATALRIMVLTGMRRSELLGHQVKARRGPREGLRWADVDLDAGTYTLASHGGGSGSKAGKPRTLPLGEATVELLHSIRPENADPDAPVVPSPRDPDAPFVGLDKPRRLIYKAAGIEGADAHCLRHTFETQCFDVDAAVAGALTGRAVVKGSLAAYVHVSAERLHKVADAVAGRIAQALDGKLADVLAFEQKGSSDA